jgi:hypothetical protein
MDDRPPTCHAHDETEANGAPPTRRGRMAGAWSRVALDGADASRGWRPTRSPPCRWVTRGPHRRELCAEPCSSRTVVRRSQPSGDFRAGSRRGRRRGHDGQLRVVRRPRRFGGSASNHQGISERLWSGRSCAFECDASTVTAPSMRLPRSGMSAINPAAGHRAPIRRGRHGTVAHASGELQASGGVHSSLRTSTPGPMGPGLSNGRAEALAYRTRQRLLTTR